MRLKWKRKPYWLKTTYWKNRAVEKASGGAVLQGPFAGVKYPPATLAHTFMPRLLGTYEKELWEVLGELLGRPFARVVHVGAGDGYFVVGFVKHGKVAETVAFEGDPQVRSVLDRVIRLNEIEGLVDVRGFCRPEDLAALAGENVLVFMDVDGGEKELLDPNRVPSLRESTILVELHPHILPGIGHTVTEWYKDSHRIRVVYAERRKSSDLPPSIKGFKALFVSAMGEHRPMSQIWYLLEPRWRKPRD